MVELRLSKPQIRVRFPSPALSLRVLILTLSAIPYQAVAEAKTIEEMLVSQIAVEVVTGRPAPEDCAGFVGSLQVSLKEATIRFPQIQVAGGPALYATWFRMSNIRKTPQKIDFDAVDELGGHWNGSFWMAEDLLLPEVVMVRDDGWRIQLLGSCGKEALKKTRATHFNLGLKRK